MDKRHCRGCESNFYNGNNNLNVKECWHFKDAKVEWRIPIGHWENPPYKNKKKVRVPNCYHERGNQRIHYVHPARITKDGFWQ